MDIISHGAWGYATLQWRGARAGWRAALAGVAPDLLFFIPFRIELVLERGWIGLLRPRTADPGIWRLDGPPLPPELVEAYFKYYRYTHSLILLAAVLVVVWLLGKREWLWLGIPYALHIVMDIPTHERYQTPFLFPLSSWTVQGTSWGRPLILYPNWIALIGVYVWLWRKNPSS